jgi:hypothetical protein
MFDTITQWAAADLGASGQDSGFRGFKERGIFRETATSKAWNADEADNNTDERRSLRVGTQLRVWLFSA